MESSSNHLHLPPMTIEESKNQSVHRGIEGLTQQFGIKGEER